MGICGFKGNKDGVFHSIVDREPDVKEEPSNPLPIQSKPVSAQEGDSRQNQMESTKQLLNGEKSEVDKDNQSEVHCSLTSANQTSHKEDQEES